MVVAGGGAYECVVLLGEGFCTVDCPWVVELVVYELFDVFVVFEVGGHASEACFVLCAFLVCRKEPCEGYDACCVGVAMCYWEYCFFRVFFFEVVCEPFDFCYQF